jgi:N-acetyl-gamma-glutamyl-phosphate reductase
VKESVLEHKIFIDGKEGTTGLLIHDRLQGREDIEVLEIDPKERKNPNAKLSLYRQSDIVLFCLPDQASRLAFELAKQVRVRVIDASTAFRTAPGWVYGLPELCPEQREKIRKASCVANCGCYAAGFILALRPLVSSGVVAKNHPITCSAISGYSGGGKKLIQKIESDPRDIVPPRPYALGLTHKHLPEMQRYVGLHTAPHFMPIVGHFYQGMIVTIPLVVETLKKRVTPDDVYDLLSAYYAGEPFIKVMPVGNDSALEDGFLSPTDCNGTNRAELFIFGNEEKILLAARLDNLGKGASGTAIQCLNLMLGLEETSGLTT